MIKLSYSLDFAAGIHAFQYVGLYTVIERKNIHEAEMNQQRK